MTLQEFIKKLGIALEDEDTAKGLESFGIKPEQIEGFKDLTVPTNLDEALKIKGVQSEFDKRLGKAAETREAKLKKKYGFGEEEEQEEEEEINTDDPAVKAMMAQMKKMSDKLEAFENEKQKETLEQKKTRAKEYLKSKGILPGYASELDLDKDFDEQFETVKEKYLEDGGTIATEDSKPKPGQRMPVPKRGDDKNEPSKEEKEKFKKVFK